jgi:hypothetical protein
MGGWTTLPTTYKQAVFISLVQKEAVLSVWKIISAHSFGCTYTQK